MKLIKKKEDWYNLYDGEIGIGSTHEELQGFKLSLKNCQSIERGYDLDELAEEWVFDKNSHKWSNNDNTAGDNYGSFKAGFKTALELMGDKKFSREFLLHLIPIALKKQRELTYTEFNDWYNSEFLKMIFDKKEWEVTIVMGPSISTPDGWESQPKIDLDGSLILKRI